MRPYMRLLVVSVMIVLLSGCFLLKREKKTKEQTAQALKRMESEEMALKKKASPERTHQWKGELADGVVARVNDEVILLSDVDSSLDDILRVTGGSKASLSPMEMARAREAALQRLIARKLLAQEAQRRKYKVDEKELEQALERYLKRRAMSREQLYVELAAQKKTISQFKEQIRRELMVYKMLQRDIRRHIHVTDEQCRRYYEAHKQDYGRPGRVRIQQIVFVTRGLDADEINKKRAKLEEIRRRIIQGKDFGELAKRYSQGPYAGKGGDLGYYKKGELLPQLDEVAFSMNVGEVSPVIETSVGLHLIRVTEREPGEAMPFDSLKEKIRSRLMEEQFQKDLEELVNGLRQSAYIEIRKAPH